jgi:hypothetical protein
LDIEENLKVKIKKNDKEKSTLLLKKSKTDRVKNIPFVELSVKNFLCVTRAILANWELIYIKISTDNIVCFSVADAVEELHPPSPFLVVQFVLDNHILESPNQKAIDSPCSVLRLNDRKFGNFHSH